MKSKISAYSQHISHPSSTVSLPEYDLHSLHLKILKEKIHKTSEFLEIINSIVRDHHDFSDWCKDQMKSSHDTTIFEYKIEIRVKENEAPIRHFTILKRAKDLQELEKTLRLEAKQGKFNVALEKLPKEKKNDPQFMYDFYHTNLVFLCSNTSIRKNFNILYEFLGISIYSLHKSLKPIHEGPIMKKKIVSADFCSSLFNTNKYVDQWMIVTKEGVGIMDSNLSKDLADHMLFDWNYELALGKSNAGASFCLKLNCNYRVLKLKTKNYLEFIVWVLGLQNAVKQCSYLGPNRYLSAFPMRNHCMQCKCLMEGEEYFASIKEAFDKAKEEIFIASVFFSPELYLTRPISQLIPHQKSRLDNILNNAAIRGVKIYIILFNEPPKFFQNSQRVLTSFTSLHQNISVLRSPGYNLNVSLWGFNEKFCVIDRTIAFLGGPDFSFGQWDNSYHNISDREYHESQHLMAIWPGKDYSNPRIRPFEYLEDFNLNILDRDSEPRLPWHSVGVMVEGGVVFDFVRHFVQSWNFLSIGREPLEVLTKKFTNNAKKHVGLHITQINNYLESKSFVCSPQNDKDVLGRMLKRAAIAAEEDAKKISIFPRTYHQKNVKETRKPKLKFFDKMVELYSLRPELQEAEENKDFGSFRCQLLRSASHWSLGLNIIDNSIQNCYVELIMSSRSFVYIENQFFISNNATKAIKNLLIEALLLRIKRAAVKGEPFKVMMVLPLVIKKQGRMDQNEELFFSEQYIYKTIFHGVNSMVELLKKDHTIKQVSDYVTFYGLRSHGRIRGVPKTEEIYIDSNLMIIDDNVVVMGSANLNDRSLMGSRDAELALVVEDTKKIESIMAGHPCKVSQFAHNMRLRLFSEHFSVESDLSRDPLNQLLHKSIEENCRKNTAYYREIFRVWPDDSVKRLDFLDLFIKEKKLSYYDMLTQKIKGHGVEFPLNWLTDEYLEKEKATVPVKNFQ